jgi:BirA family biotin operon repressor/biotin-[acetyl-CoA-carboxylase] ligase
MDRRERLLRILADGRFHSGQSLAATLGVSRTVIWKQIRQLAASDLDVYAVRGRGYRLAQPIELLDAGAIRAQLAPSATRRLTALELHFQIDSTNRRLLELAAVTAIAGHVCLAEYQSAGRGRRGRGWVSPPGSGIYLSLGWSFDAPPESLTGLSLAAGVAALRALRRLRIDAAGLKWPNDIVVGERKLGGILIEVRGETTGPCTVVAGVGVNVELPERAARRIDQPWTDLARAGYRPSRNLLAAALIDELVRVFSEYEERGFAACAEEWRCYDCGTGRMVRLVSGGHTLAGRMLGIDDSGALLLSVDGAVRRFTSGEISLRMDA